jgi:hypothetical protein
LLNHLSALSGASVLAVIPVVRRRHPSSAMPLGNLRSWGCQDLACGAVCSEFAPMFIPMSLMFLIHHSLPPELRPPRLSLAPYPLPTSDHTHPGSSPFPAHSWVSRGMFLRPSPCINRNHGGIGNGLITIYGRIPSIKTKWDAVSFLYGSEWRCRGRLLSSCCCPACAPPPRQALWIVGQGRE